VLLVGAGAAGFQYQAAPSAYSLTDHNSLAAPMTETFYRDGDLVMTDVVWAPLVTAWANMPHGEHIRAIYDLAHKTGWSWDPSDASIPCIRAFGTWGNPFEWISQLFGDDLSQLHPKQLDTEMVAGRAATVYELTLPTHEKVRVWRDQTFGLLLKMATPGKSGTDETQLEVTQFRLEKPSSSVFVPPSRCPTASPP